jgi:hypothetical protein
VSRALWTGLAIAGAVLVETALSYLVASPGRYIDPFLLVVVYCALSFGETHGMLAGAAAGRTPSSKRWWVLGALEAVSASWGQSPGAS